MSIGVPIGIYFTGAVAAAKNLASEYNEKFRNPETGKLQLSKCVRKQHFQLVEALLKIIGRRSYIKRNSDELPELYATRGSLARLLDCSEKTIYNLLLRLEEAGFLSKEFRSSNFQLKITLHESLLITKKRISSEDLNAEAQSLEIQEAEEVLETFLLDNKTSPKSIDATAKNLISGEAEKSLTSQLERKTLPNNIHTIKQKKLSLIKDVDMLDTSSQTDLESNISALNKTEKPTRNHDLKTPKGSEEGNEETTPHCARPPQNLTEFGLLTPEMDKIHIQATELWNYAHYRLYNKIEFLSAAQIIDAMTYFAKGLLQFSTPEKRASVAENMMTRIELVGKYIDKDPTKRFVPLPSTYFDVNNPHGFSTTRVWLKKTKELPAIKQSMRSKSILIQHVQKDIMEIYMKTDWFNINSFKHAVNKIEAYQPELVQGFLKYHLSQLSIQSQNQNS